MHIQEFEHLFLYMHVENMYVTCMYYVHARIYQPKQGQACYLQAQARCLEVLHEI